MWRVGRIGRRGHQDSCDISCPRSSAFRNRANSGTSVVIDIVTVVTFFDKTVEDSISAALWHAVDTTLGIRMIGIPVACITEFECRLDDAITAFRQGNPLADIVAVIVVHTVTVVALLIQRRLHDTVATVSNRTCFAAGALAVAAQRAILAILLLCFAQAGATVVVTNVAVVTFFADLDTAVAAGWETGDLAGDAAVWIH